MYEAMVRERLQMPVHSVAFEAWNWRARSDKPTGAVESARNSSSRNDKSTVSVPTCGAARPSSGRCGSLLNWHPFHRALG